VDGVSFFASAETLAMPPSIVGFEIDFDFSCSGAAMFARNFVLNSRHDLPWQESGETPHLLVKSSPAY
jgi:hypothetical protein